jgi:hypothetical protein
MLESLGGETWLEVMLNIFKTIIKLGLKTNFTEGIIGDDKDLIDRDEHFGNNRKPVMHAKVNFNLHSSLVILLVTSKCSE